MSIELWRPLTPDEDDNRYVVVVDGGDSSIEFYDRAGVMHDIGVFDHDTHDGSKWGQCTEWLLPLAGPGPVVHVRNPVPDLLKLPIEQLRALRAAVIEELQVRSAKQMGVL